MFSMQVLPTQGYVYTRDSESSLSAIFRSLTEQKEAQVSEGPSITFIEMPSTSSTYLFTRTGHFAHASVLIRKVVRIRSARVIEVSGITATSEQVMEEWLMQFQSESQQVRRGYGSNAEA
jgi:hypothetical protein